MRTSRVHPVFKKKKKRKKSLAEGQQARNRLPQKLDGLVKCDGVSDCV